MNAAQAFIAFLKTEANNAETRARSLRATAAAIEANAHEARTRKKRKREPKTKRSCTAYTLFVHENYDSVKRTHGADLPSKDIISIIARQWSETSPEEKEAWQFRADQINQQGGDLNSSGGGEMPEAIIQEVGLPEPPSAEDDRKPAARKSLPKTTGVASVSI